MKRSRQIEWSGDRGEGTIFFFVDETGAKVSRNLYLAYWAGRKEHLLSAKTDDLGDAKRELRRLTRHRENAKEGKGPLITPKTERVTVGELLDANIRRAEKADLAGLRQMKYQTEILRALLGRVRALEFRPEHVDSYLERRLQGEGSRHGKKVGEKTIQNELGVLTKAFKYALERGVVHYAPFIEKPGVSPERKKEIDVRRYPQILKAMPDADARDFIEWMLLTARRPKGIGALRWEWWDQKKGTIQMPSEKGGSPTVFSVRGYLEKLFERRLAARRLDCPFIFHRNGEPLRNENVRPYFYEALKACGIPTGRAEGFVPYDTKKTAMGLMVDAGLTVEEIMAFSGHRSRAMVERYVVRNADRQARSVDKRDRYLKKVLSEKAPLDSERVAVFPNVSEA